MRSRAVGQLVGTLRVVRNLLPDHVRGVVLAGDLNGSAPGAALIIDAAGSTLLSVQLREHGTDGAESLADVISAVFTPMVEEVVGHGGFVAEFAGDGIIAVFLGDVADATERAVTAGRSIMAILAELDDVPTPVGPARLAVRGIVGAGSVEWRVWQSEADDAWQNAAYTFVGSAIAEAQRGELLTEPGIFSIGPVARATDETLRGDQLAAGFVSIAPSIGHGTAPPPTQTNTRPDGWRFFPEVIERSTKRGEFREVVSVFLELSDLPNGGRGDNSMADVVGRVAEHGGYICDVIRSRPDEPGVRILAFWGAPRSHEHDIGRALRCVAAIRHDMGQSQIRAGVTLDTVFAGYVGAQRQESYTCVGAGVNLAARICGHAGWGEIRINDQIAESLDPRWTFEDLGELAYKGFLRPTQTYGLTRIPAVIRSFPFDDTFVGRTAELAALEKALSPMWDGEPAGVIVLVGEAGIGKGHLITELRRRLDQRTPPAAWLSGESNESHSQPLATLVDALEGYFGGLTEDLRGTRMDAYIGELIGLVPDMAPALERARVVLADLLELTEDAAHGHLDPKSRFENTVQAIRDLTVAVGTITPVIVHNADAQWLDSGTVEILRRLRDLESTPFAILIDTREELPDLPADRLIELAPLCSGDLAALTRQMLGETPSPELVELIGDRSAGNPFFAREILDYMRRELLFASGPHGLEARFHGEGLPTDLRRIVIADLDDLGPEVLRTVQTAAVIGREFDHDVLEAMLDGRSVDAHIEAAVQARIIEPTAEGVCRFRHSVVRDTAYSMQLHSEVRMLHIAAAEAIQRLYPDDESRAAQLAYHFDRAAHEADASAQYLRAARTAASRYANREAMAHIERGLELLDDESIGLRFELLDLERAIHDRVGDRHAQEMAIDAMETSVESTDQRLEVALRRGELYNALGEYDAAEAAVASAVEQAESGKHDDALVALLFLLGRLARHRGDTDGARAFATRAQDLVDADSDPVHAAYLEDFLGSVEWDVGDFESAARLHRAAAVALGRTGDAIGEVQTLNNLGSALFGLWDYPAALKIHEQGVLRSREIGFRLGEGDHLDNVGGAAWAVGDYATAIARYSEALAIRTEMEDALGIAVSTSNLAGAYLAIGDLAESRRLYEAALEVDRRIGRRRGEAYDWHGLGLTRLEEGDFAGAVGALDRAIAIRQDLGELHLCNESKIACALAHKRNGNLTEAAEIVDTVLHDEGDDPFAGAAEATASFLRAIEVLDESDPSRAGQLTTLGKQTMMQRAARISDPRFRRMYLEDVASHRDIADR